MKLNPKFLAEKTWDLYQTHGVPIEVSEDILEAKGFSIDKGYLDQLVEEHQKLSQSKSTGQFKSGLGENTDKTRRLHTVTHILHKVLRDNFGQDVKQTGSAITNEKARFDFTFNRRLEEDELEKIQIQVQEIINKNLNMQKVETTESEARKLGAIGLFGEKYGDIVTIYTLADDSGEVYSREFCGGPHVDNSKQIGNFKIIKQKSVGAGVKRIEYNVE